MKLVVTVVFAVFASQAALAQDAKPSEASIRQLFEVMHSSKLLDAYVDRSTAQQPTPKQQKIMETLGHNIASLVKEELNWASFEPMMIEVYRNTFSQHEVDGMLRFYRSEAGQAVIAKLPTAMQQTMASMQSHVKTLTPKIVQLEKDSAAQLKAAGEPQQAPQSPQGAQPPQSPPPQP